MIKYKKLKNPFKNKKLYILSIIFLFFAPVTLILFFISMLIGLDKLNDFSINVLSLGFIDAYGRYSDYELSLYSKSETFCRNYNKWGSD